ncbi:putative holin-like toxin [Longirhabdus pacifica]|nr:putative holin-like toxin [Longirhabdus pacifica]
MKVYEVISLILKFGTFLIALLSFIVVLITTIK